MTARHNRQYRVEIDGNALARLRRAYADPEISIHTLKTRFRLSDYAIREIAVSNNWPLRVKAGRSIGFAKADAA